LATKEHKNGQFDFLFLCSSWLAMALAAAAAFFRGHAFFGRVWPGCVNFAQSPAPFFIF
jgi:hypothetical protein